LYTVYILDISWKLDKLDELELRHRPEILTARRRAGINVRSNASQEGRYRFLARDKLECSRFYREHHELEKAVFPSSYKITHPLQKTQKKFF